MVEEGQRKSEHDRIIIYMSVKVVEHSANVRTHFSMKSGPQHYYSKWREKEHAKVLHPELVITD